MTDDPTTPNDAVQGVQQWMALDLHMALGRPIDMRSEVRNQGFDSWADWWADLCAAVREHRTSNPDFVPYLLAESSPTRPELPARGPDPVEDEVASVIAKELLNNLDVDLSPAHAQQIARNAIRAQMRAEVHRGGPAAK